MAAELCSFTVHIDTGRWSENVLTTVDLLVPRGRITAVLGGPGAGKTMVAYALTGHLPDTAQSRGQVLIDGRPVPDGGWPELRGGTVGYIPQEGGTAPAVLIADSPATSLDRETAYHVWKSLRDCADSGAAVLAISNDVPMLTGGGFADRMVIMHAGRILATGSPAQLADSEDAHVAALMRSGL